MVEETPDEWKASVIVPIYKGKGDVVSFGSNRGAKLLENAMKIVVRVLKKQIRTLINLNIMLGKCAVDAIFIEC